MPAALDRNVFHRQWARAAVLHRAVLAARLRELYAWRRYPADAARDLDRAGLSRFPQGARDAGAEVIAVGRGYGLACLTGARAAADADIVVFMDGDGADDPAAIAALIAPIQSGSCDFVIASRARGTREPGSMAWHQLL